MQDQQKFKDYLICKNIYYNFEIAPKRKLPEITLVDKENVSNIPLPVKSGKKNHGISISIWHSLSYELRFRNLGTKNAVKNSKQPKMLIYINNHR